MEGGVSLQLQILLLLLFCFFFFGSFLFVGKLFFWMSLFLFWGGAAYDFYDSYYYDVDDVDEDSIFSFKHDRKCFFFVFARLRNSSQDI